MGFNFSVNYVRTVLNSCKTHRTYFFRDPMFISKPLPFVESFIEEINQAIKKYDQNLKLTRIQRTWLSFCILAIYLTRTVCWAKYERASLGDRSVAAISWMFRHSTIPWEKLLVISTIVIIKRFGITGGCIAIDETDKKRSKSSKKIYKLHKIKDKASGGYVMGQKLVFIVLIAKNITIPVGFQFYMPDPQLKEWKKQDEKLRKQGVAKKDRPAKPDKDDNYPQISEIALNLLGEFKVNHPQIKVQCIVADALYGTKSFMDDASKIFGGVQVISQIKETQNIVFGNRRMQVKKYFESHPGVEQKVRLRGGEETTVTVGSARLNVCSHGKKRFVIALKYKGEEDYRYIVATDLSWRTLDIVEAYSLRWLIEVVFEDWKANEGWNKLTKHVGEDGSRRGVILSLLSDHCLFFHPDQQALIDDNLPAYTVGSMMCQIRIENFLQFIRELTNCENPGEKLDTLAETLKKRNIQSVTFFQTHVGKAFGQARTNTIFEI